MSTQKHKGLKSTKSADGCFLTSIAAFLEKHWVFNLVFVNLSAVWLPILYTFFGVQLQLVIIDQQSSQTTTLGFALMVFFLAVIVVGNGAIVYDKKTRKEDFKVEKLKHELQEQTEIRFVLSQLNSSASSLCENKLSTLIDQVDFYIKNSAMKAPTIISNPIGQLDFLAKELSFCLATLLKVQERHYITELFTSIIYRFPQENDKEWHWATRERGLSISELTDEQGAKKSTFQTLLNSRDHSIFENSKQVLYEKGQYIPDNEDEYDENGKLKGSIACYQCEIKKNNRVIIEFVITITSYAQQFAQAENDGDMVVKNIRYNLERVVIPHYFVRAKTELCLLYIKMLNERDHS